MISLAFQAALGVHGQTHLLWKTLEPVLTDSGLSLLSTATFAHCPANLDVLFVPGGFGTNDMLQDAEVLAFLAEQGKTARHIISACSGLRILAAAGLLDGYKAANQWACYETSETLGIEGAPSRWSPIATGSQEAA